MALAPRARQIQNQFSNVTGTCCQHWLSYVWVPFHAIPGVQSVWTTNCFDHTCRMLTNQPKPKKKRVLYEPLFLVPTQYWDSGTSNLDWNQAWRGRTKQNLDRLSVACVALEMRMSPTSSWLKVQQARAPTAGNNPGYASLSTVNLNSLPRKRFLCMWRSNAVAIQ